MGKLLAVGGHEKSRQLLGGCWHLLGLRCHLLLLRDRWEVEDTVVVCVVLCVIVIGKSIDIVIIVDDVVVVVVVIVVVVVVCRREGGVGEAAKDVLGDDGGWTERDRTGAHGTRTGGRVRHGSGSHIPQGERWGRDSVGCMHVGRSRGLLCGSHGIGYRNWRSGIASWRKDRRGWHLMLLRRLCGHRRCCDLDGARR